MKLLSFIALCSAILMVPAAHAAPWDNLVLAPLQTVPAGGGTPHYLTTADFDHDGVSELVLGQLGPNRMLLYENDGAGFLTLDTTYTSSGGPTGVIPLDVNVDGWDDIVILLSTGSSSGIIQAYVNDQAGNLLPGWSQITPGSPETINWAFLNNDSIPDILVAYQSMTFCHLFFGDGSEDSLVPPY